MKKKHLFLMFAMSACLLNGCGNVAKKYDANTLIVKKNGVITEVAVENFKDSSVKSEDLEAYIDEQIDSFNAENGKTVKKKHIDTDDMENVKLEIQYKDMQSFNAFNLLECSLDSYDNLKDEVKGEFASVDGDKVKADQMQDVEKANVLILTEKTDVVVKGKILYYNNQVKVKDQVVSTTGKDDAIIIFK